MLVIAIRIDKKALANSVAKCATADSEPNFDELMRQMIEFPKTDRIHHALCDSRDALIAFDGRVPAELENLHVASSAALINMLSQDIAAELIWIASQVDQFRHLREIVGASLLNQSIHGRRLSKALEREYNRLRMSQPALFHELGVAEFLEALRVEGRCP